MEHILKIENLSLKYEEKNVIDDLSFHVKKGEFLGIAGRNGSGKSTLSRLLVGLEVADSGKIYYLDEEYKFKTMTNIREKVSLVFQNPNNQIIGNTVLDDLAFALENRGIHREAIKERVYWIAEKFNLLDLLEKNPSELSGGQKQMVAIAGVLIFNPEVLILDEVTSMLDAYSKKIVREMLNEIKKDHTIIHITHDAEDLLETDRVVVLDRGKIALDINPIELFKDMSLCKKHMLQKPFYYEAVDTLKIAEKSNNSEESVEEWLSKLK
ncbi:MAG: energy-coupling factor ABC transporter ATP-binding protein [Fusobacteriaceae bacterium]